MPHCLAPETTNAWGPKCFSGAFRATMGPGTAGICTVSALYGSTLLPHHPHRRHFTWDVPRTSSSPPPAPDGGRQARSGNASGWGSLFAWQSAQVDDLLFRRPPLFELRGMPLVSPAPADLPGRPRFRSTPLAVGGAALRFRYHPHVRSVGQDMTGRRSGSGDGRPRSRSRYAFFVRLEVGRVHPADRHVSSLRDLDKKWARRLVSAF